MKDSADGQPPQDDRPRSTEQTLRRLFLTLFLRGRSSRGLNRKNAPKSVGRKLALSLVFYLALGLLAFALRGKSVFVVALYLHSLTFFFLGMFVASSAGEILFNKEEADILLHRPIEPRALLWAKIRVLVEVSLWLAGCLNLAGFYVGSTASNGGWMFLAAHAISTAMEALFCTGCVVMVYQLCLRWFGRERLDGLMTTAQVAVSVGAVLIGQLFPQFIFRANGITTLNAESWWIGLLPPTWFAGFDDALSGSMSTGSWLLAALAVAATATVLAIAFVKLAQDYESGLKTLNESVSPAPRRRDSRRWIAAIVDLPPLRWWLRDPVAKATFILTAAYLMRDREVKLRIFPGIAPMLVIPLIFLVRQAGHGGFAGSAFGVAFAGGYLGLIPLVGLQLMQYSQQWRAADIFRAAPLSGPAPVCAGARRAILLFLTLPVAAAVLLIVLLTSHESALLLLLIPGAIALPVYSLIPNIGGGAMLLSMPAEDAKSIGRGLSMMAVMFVSMALSGVAAVSWSSGWFWWFILGEAVVAAGVYAVLHHGLTNAAWSTSE